MNMSEKNMVNVAVVGLNFGSLFVPNYKFHPGVADVAVCDLDPTLVKRVGDRWDIAKRYSSLDDVLADDSIDVVHLLTGITLHADQAVAVLEAGKHCVCAVPMALNIEDVERIVDAQRRSGKMYMLAETVIFTRNYLYVDELIRSGDMGAIQFLKGAHYQDMEGWPTYWKGMPPMYYATHALAPAFAATNSTAKRVVCFGSGHMRSQLHEQYGNPYPMETALFEMETGILSEVTRTLFNNPRGYTEAFTVSGENITFETGQLDSDQPVVWKYLDNGDYDPDMRLEEFTTMGRQVSETRIDPPDQFDRIPESLHRFTRPHTVTSLTDPTEEFEYATIGGFHPHLVHHVVRSVVDGTPPFFDIRRSANLTAACLCAHESAMSGGASIDIPVFD